MGDDRGDDVRLHRITATFVDAALEAEFRKETFEASVRRFTRFSITLSALAFLSYGLHDALVIPEVLREAWTIRFGITVPVFLALVPFVYSRWAGRWHQPAMFVFGMTLNLVVLWIGAISPPAGFFIYTSYAIVFVTLGAFIAKMNVSTQALYTLSTIALYLAFDVTRSHATLPVRLSVVLTLISMGSIGALAAHQLEVQAREAFLARRRIKKQMAEIDAEKAKSEALLLNILPATIAEQLKTDSRAIADGFADVSVLFSDIVGFTQMSARMSPQELVQRLDEVFTRFDAITRELGLEKIKTIGDAYMVASGIPVQREDHAKAICQMALRMQACLVEMSKDSGFSLGVRIGINSGPVVAGVIGKNKFIYDVWGDTVNTASRMESHGAEGSIHVTEETYRRVEGDFLFEPRGEIEVKGKGKMRTYFLLGPKT